MSHFLSGRCLGVNILWIHCFVTLCVQPLFGREHYVTHKHVHTSGSRAKKMRKGQFHPFGFTWREFGLPAASLMLFLAFSVLGKQNEKDAQGSISSLRVHMEGVWAPGSFFDAVLGIFRFWTKQICASRFLSCLRWREKLVSHKLFHDCEKSVTHKSRI